MNPLYYRLPRALLFILTAILPVSAYGLPAARDFPSDIPAAEVDNVASAYDCEKVVIGAPVSGILLIPRGSRTNSDGKYHHVFRTACHVYVADPSVPVGATQVYTQRFLVYGESQESRSLMTGAAKMLDLLWHEANTRLRRDHSPDEPTVQVWLNDRPGAGLSADTAGEQFKNQIYLYDVQLDRRPIEWAREIAHEYGHYSLPGICGFKQPEEWANGVLGERLYLNWISADLTAGRLKSDDVPLVTEAEITDYVHKQVYPLIETVCAHGTGSIDFKRRDAVGMDNYTALALYIDRVYGSAQLAAAMNYTEPANRDSLAEATDFVHGFVASMQAAPVLRVHIVTPVTPGPAAFALFLPAGSYSIEPQGVVGWNIAAAGKTALQHTARSLRVAHPGWYMLTITGHVESSSVLVFTKQKTSGT